MLVQILLWMLWKWDKSLPKLETSVSVHEDSVNKHSVSEFLSPKLLHMIQKLDEQLNLFYPFFIQIQCQQEISGQCDCQRIQHGY